MGKNWRSYRRGYERRFVSGIGEFLAGFSSQVLALPLARRRRAFIAVSNCYNFGEPNSQNPAP